VPVHRDFALLAGLAGVVAVVDQLTKLAVTATIGPGRAVSRLDIIGELVAFEYAENRGAAFGVFAGLGPLVAFAAVAIVAGMLVYYARADASPLWQTVAFGVIAGGALGNLLDRVRLGYVVDFVAVGAWPNFNVADSAITLGIVSLALGWLRGEPANERGSPRPSQ
jgi:signal peptidase II